MKLRLFLVCFKLSSFMDAKKSFKKILGFTIQTYRSHSLICALHSKLLGQPGHFIWRLCNGFSNGDQLFFTATVLLQTFWIVSHVNNIKIPSLLPELTETVLPLTKPFSLQQQWCRYLYWTIVSLLDADHGLPSRNKDVEFMIKYEDMFHFAKCILK